MLREGIINHYILIFLSDSKISKNNSTNYKNMLFSIYYTIIYRYILSYIIFVILNLSYYIIVYFIKSFAVFFYFKEKLVRGIS